MRIRKQDMKTLEKIKKMCDKSECSDCSFNNIAECILQNQPNWWRLDRIVKED